MTDERRKEIEVRLAELVEIEAEAEELGDMLEAIDFVEGLLYAEAEGFIEIDWTEDPEEGDELGYVFPAGEAIYPEVLG